MKQTMWAQVITGFGDANVFREIEIPVPIPQKHDDVLVAVKATSLNPVDAKIRSGIAAGLSPDFPAVLHGDVAGVVVQVGPGHSKFKIGDEVFGCVGGVKGSAGTLSEYVLADENLLTLKPKSLSFQAAAAIPLVGITAWEALIDRARIRPGQNVLVHGAVGGVGHMGVQLSKCVGAKVFATASTPEKMDIGYRLGADMMIDYNHERVADYVQKNTDGAGFEVVFDTIGGENLDNSFAAAALNGTVVSVSTLSTHDLSLLHLKGLTLHVVFMLIPILHHRDRAHHGEILHSLSKLADAGTIVPLIHPETFAIREVAKAHSFWETGNAMGKIVLTL